MSQEVEDFFAAANKVQWAKNKDYHPDRVAFLEILRTCAETGISVEQDLWAKLRKQYIALRGYLIDGRVESEPPRQRMIDIAVYIGMMAFWDENKKQILRDALIFVGDRTRCENRERCGPGNTEVKCDRCMFFFWLEDQVRKVC